MNCPTCGTAGYYQPLMGKGECAKPGCAECPLVPPLPTIKSGAALGLAYAGLNAWVPSSPVAVPAFILKPVVTFAQQQDIARKWLLEFER